MGRKQIDLTGRRIGKLTVLRKIETGGYERGCVIWEYKCDCGNIGSCYSRALLAGNRKSCGCLGAESNHKISFKDISGQKFGRLLAVSSTGESGSGGDLKWYCICDCGKSKVVTGCHLREKPGTRSCGCMSNELQKSQLADKHPAWKGFGEVAGGYFRRIKLGADKRGLSCDITVEDIWNQFIKQGRKCALTGLELEFKFKGAMNRHKITASLDRIDSSKGYSKDNIQIVHKDINQIKLDLDQDKFIYYCKLVAEKFKE